MEKKLEKALILKVKRLHKAFISKVKFDLGGKKVRKRLNFKVTVNLCSNKKLETT
jgi:hypothetical protein